MRSVAITGGKNRAKKVHRRREEDLGEGGVRNWSSVVLGVKNAESEREDCSTLSSS